ncbi:TraB/GumN family protein [Pedobacter borealis]|uniref:TraB/GumN family protein n=1 Tax=Pedobacter borealis TaxID=475254 RepID=UPI000AD68A66|nr:TraB/GumN family protein [Pedobacter borealis]
MIQIMLGLIKDKRDSTNSGKALIRTITFLIIIIGLVVSTRLPAQSNAPVVNTLLWKISGNGLTQPSYLFGSNHLICKKDAEGLISDLVKQAIKSVDEVCFEVYMSNSAQMIIAQKYNDMVNDVKLNQLLTSKEMDTVNNYYQNHPEIGIPKEAINTLKPSLFSSMISVALLPCHKEISNMEDVISTLGKENDKKISGISTYKEQLGFIDSIPYQQQAKDLMAKIRLLNNLTEENNSYLKTLKLYIAQDAVKLDSVIKGGSTDRFAKIIGEERNKRWMPRFKQKLQTQTLFIAVGFAHLFGPEGLINLFIKNGYTVEGIKN